LFFLAGIPEYIEKVAEELVEEEKKKDDLEADPLNPDHIALLGLSESDQRKLVAIQHSMLSAEPAPMLRFAPDDEEDCIAQLVNTRVDDDILDAEDEEDLVVMAVRMNAYCDFRPPVVYARYLQGLSDQYSDKYSDEYSDEHSDEYLDEYSNAYSGKYSDEYLTPSSPLLKDLNPIVSSADTPQSPSSDKVSSGRHWKQRVTRGKC
jgi:molybdopterin-biosynthesis enzyme MoeA-like protein